MKTNLKIKRRGGLSPDKYLSEEQIKRLLKYLRKRADAGSRRAAINEFIVIMLLNTGLRAEELLALRLKNLPGYHGKNIVEVEQGKGNVYRPVEIPDWLSEYIESFVKQHRKWAKPNGILIPSERGHRRVRLRSARIIEGKRVHKCRTERNCRMTYHSLYEKLKRIGKASKIGELHPHMLRHTYLVMLYNVNGDLRFTQDQAGHASVETTIIYTKTYAADRTRQLQNLPRPFVG